MPRSASDEFRTSAEAAVSVVLSDASPSALSAHAALLHAASAHAALAQAAVPQMADAHAASDHAALAQAAVPQMADAHAASDHAALAQAALFHAAFDRAADCQAAASNTFDPSAVAVRNWFSPAFGFGGLATVRAAATFTEPTPSEPGTAAGVGRAVSIRAPLT